MTQRTTRTSVTKASLALLLLAAVASAQEMGLADFSWTLVGTPSGPSSIDATSIHLVGPDGASCTSPIVYYETTAPLAGTVTVRLDWTTFDICHYDWPITLVDGVYTKVPEISDCWLPGTTYFLDFDVPAGSTFGLGVGSTDCIEGPGVADYTEFAFTPTVWLDAGGALDPRLEQTWQGTHPVSDLGWSVGAPGDLDGDGVDDAVLGYPGDSTVEARSGATGALLWTRTRTLDYGRAIASPGDVDLDGVPDVAISRPALDRIHMESGADGQGIWVQDLPGPLNTAVGWELAELGDVDGDGVRDLVVGASGVFTVPVISGVDGSTIHLLDPPVFEPSFGIAVASAGDVDGDGVDDVFVGAPSALRAHVFSGSTGAQLLELQPPPGSFTSYSLALASAGDIDHDGHDDLLVGAPSANAPGPIGAAGAVVLHSGLDGSAAKVFYGSEPLGHFGKRILGALDVNNDGSLDMAVAEDRPAPAVPAASGRVTLRRAVGGQLLGTLDGTEEDGGFGYRMAASRSGSVTSLVVGAPFDAAGGRATLWRDLALPGAPRLVGGGFPIPGQPWTLDVLDGRPSATTGFVLGASALAAPFKGGVLVPNPDVIVFLALDAQGELHLGGTWPASIPTSVVVWMQVWIQEPAAKLGWSATNALQTLPL